MISTKLLNFFLALTVLGIFFSGCKDKEGCTDPASLNYDPDAKEDDGSCIYDLSTIYEDLGNGVTQVTDRGEGTGTLTWTSGTTWLLDGFVFVNSGQTLTIEPGTIIKGKSGTGNNASALIVARGGRIIAQGTEQAPIIFTAQSDDVANISDIQEGTRGLWGGLIILGHARLNSGQGETQIEGLPITEERGLYGGSNDNDDSGILTYVSIRYGGTDIGSGNEINGVTFGGVGNGTTVEHIEVVNNADDGFEFFGGTVNTKWLVAAFCADDAFDYDEGFRGMGQFWFVLQASDDGDRGGEHDGGTTPEDGLPYATPMIYNATYIGRGEAEGKRAITFRDNAGGEYHNSLFVEYGKGIDIEMLGSGQHSYQRKLDDELKLEGNVFWNVAGNVADDIFTLSPDGVSLGDSTTAADALKSYFTSANNSVMNPMIGITRTADGMLDPNPGEPTLLSGASPAADTWFEQVTYKGAFDGSNNWLANWSFLDTEGYF